MLATALGLAAVAVLLALPVPALLARAAWPARAPATALVAWQAVALAGGLSMIGAPLALAATPYGDDLLRGIAGLVRSVAGGTAHPISVLLLVLAVLLAVWLVAHLVGTVVQVARQRRRHLALLELLSSAHPTRGATRVIDDAAPVAYCLPRGMGSATVLSRGLIELLDPDELDAVVGHEAAHVRQRHDVVLVAFRAWRSALRRFPVAALAEDRVAELIEMLADDQARRRVPDAVLARAIEHVGGVGSDVGPARRRILRLAAADLPLAARLGVVAASVALVALPTLWIVVPVLV